MLRKPDGLEAQTLGLERDFEVEGWIEPTECDAEFDHRGRTPRIGGRSQGGRSDRYCELIAAGCHESESLLMARSYQRLQIPSKANPTG